MQAQIPVNKQIAQQFLSEYYGAIMNKRDSLIMFYSEESHMSYNGEVKKGI